MEELDPNEIVKPVKDTMITYFCPYCQSVHPVDVIDYDDKATPPWATLLCIENNGEYSSSGYNLLEYLTGAKWSANTATEK